MIKIGILKIIFVCFFFVFLLSNFVMAQENDNNFNFNASEHSFPGMDFFQIFGSFLLICIIILVVIIIIGIISAVWIYKDANKRGGDGIIWVVLIIICTLSTLFIGFFSLAGIIAILIIWLVVRPPIGGKPKSESYDRQCPNCGRPIPMDAKACPYCAKIFDN